MNELTPEHNAPLISVVVPIYNEEKNVRPLLERLKKVFTLIGGPWEVILAMDPSPDRTREAIMECIGEGYPIRLVIFSRRIGKPLSVLAGLDHCRGEACVIIDSDLQDPPELIPEMVKKWREGFKVVIGRRTSREGENYLYLKCAQLFYWLLKKISEANVPSNTGDFRLLDARVVKEICRFRERHAFLRGLTAAAGFQTAVIPFDRSPRLAGRANISFMGAINIALDGIIPFSRTPLRLMLVLGLIYVLTAKVIFLIWLVSGLVKGFSDAWLVQLLCMLVLGFSGLIVACLGVVGEYVVRAYEEARNRPLYTVDEIIESDTLTQKAARSRSGPVERAVES